MAFSDLQLRRLFESPFPVKQGLMPSREPSLGEPLRFASPSYEELSPIISSTGLNVSPSGLDLTVGSHIAEADFFMSSLGEKDFFSMNPKDIEGKKHVLLRDKNGSKIYYILSDERLNLPLSLEYFVDARSTTGRVATMCHQVGRFSSGEVITAVQPFKFPIEIESGKTSLSQAVIRYKGSEFLDYEGLRKGYNKDERNSSGIHFSRGETDVFMQSLRPEGLLMTFSTGLIYVAKDCNEPINMDVVNEYDPSLYFDVIEGNGRFRIDNQTFCLAGTRETIGLENICGRISREHYVSGSGLWSHFAGIVQAGFNGPITLECYSLGSRVIKEGEAAGLVIFDKIDGPVMESYKGSYQNQTAPRLPKMFKQFVKV